MDWFARWFNEDYARLYAHHSDVEAAAHAAFIVERLSLPPGSAVLDVACGGGRHVRAFARLGHEAVGADLSFTLLRDARQAGDGAEYVRADMRALPFRDGSFRAVTSFFTSFGYFADPADDQRALQEWRRVLAPRGSLVLDYLNAPRVRAALNPRTTRTVDGAEIAEERRLSADGSRVVKRITIVRPGRKADVFEESVRLYDASELESALSSVGFTVRAKLGDLTGVPYDGESPRLVIIATSPESAGGAESR